MSFEWAKDYPEIQRLCERFSMDELLKVENFKYTQIKSIIQNGPTCGIVALAMCINCDQGNLVEKLLENAIELGYSNNGELFSAKYMYDLAKSFSNHEVKLYEGNLDSNEISDFLYSGGLILVPYDAEKDHTPGFVKGHKAHWAAVCGIITTMSNTYIICRQGKSKRLFIWPMSTIAASNDQLQEISPIRQAEEREYIVPEGGISGPLGLKRKAVLLKSKCVQFS